LGEKKAGVCRPVNISLDVHVAQDRVQHVSQGDFVISRLPVVADDSLPLDQRFDAASELPGGHVRKAQQPAVGSFPVPALFGAGAGFSFHFVFQEPGL